MMIFSLLSSSVDDIVNGEVSGDDQSCQSKDRNSNMTPYFQAGEGVATQLKVDDGRNHKSYQMR